MRIPNITFGGFRQKGMIDDSIVPRDELDVEESAKLDASPLYGRLAKNIDRLCSQLPDDFSFKEYTLLDGAAAAGYQPFIFQKKYPFKCLRI